MPSFLPFVALVSLLLLISGCSGGGDDKPGVSLAGSTAAPATATAPPAQPESTQESQLSTPTPAETPLATPTVVPTEAPAPLPPANLNAGGAADVQVDSLLESLLLDYLGRDTDVGVVVRHLETGQGAAINAGADFYAASVFKVFVMYEVYRQRELGNLSFAEEMEVTQEWIDLSLGQSQYTTPGQVVTVGAALEAMITVSDNVTANMLADRAGWDNIRASVAGFGLSSTVLGGGELRTTAGDYAHFLQLMACPDCVGQGVSNEILDLMSRQQIRDRIPKYLPAGTRVANKTGSWDNVTHDGGIVFSPAGPYVIVVMIGSGSANETIAEISGLVYAHYNP